jgi:hypothetical protein
LFELPTMPDQLTSNASAALVVKGYSVEIVMLLNSGYVHSLDDASGVLKLLYVPPGDIISMVDLMHTVGYCPRFPVYN